MPDDEIGNNIFVKTFILLQPSTVAASKTSWGMVSKKLAISNVVKASEKVVLIIINPKSEFSKCNCLNNLNSGNNTIAGANI